MSSPRDETAPQFLGLCGHPSHIARLTLGHAAGLTQFGVNLLELGPGAWSSQRHWHAHEDEAGSCFGRVRRKAWDIAIRCAHGSSQYQSSCLYLSQPYLSVCSRSGCFAASGSTAGFGHFKRARRMKKVAVLRNTGGGKSTLAKRLAGLTRLPLYPLDLIQYRVDGGKVPGIAI